MEIKLPINIGDKVLFKKAYFNKEQNWKKGYVYDIKLHSLINLCGIVTIKSLEDKDYTKILSLDSKYYKKIEV